MAMLFPAQEDMEDPEDLSNAGRRGPALVDTVYVNLFDSSSISIFAMSNRDDTNDQSAVCNLVSTDFRMTILYRAITFDLFYKILEAESGLFCAFVKNSQIMGVLGQ
jgi:hypothetical protein